MSDLFAFVPKTPRPAGPSASEAVVVDLDEMDTEGVSVLGLALSRCPEGHVHLSGHLDTPQGVGGFEHAASGWDEALAIAQRLVDRLG